jgi:hypothetical protein
MPNTRAVQESAQLISLALARASFHEKYKTNKFLSIRLYGGNGEDHIALTGRISGGSGHLFARFIYIHIYIYIYISCYRVALVYLLSVVYKSLVSFFSSFFTMLTFEY